MTQGRPWPWQRGDWQAQGTVRSSAATVGPWCDVLAAHHQCGSVFSAQFCPFQADTNFSHGSVAAQIWDAFPLPFLSPPL